MAGGISSKRAGRETATNTWAKLTPLEREAILAWFLGSYCPMTYAVRYPLIKTDTLNSASSAIAEHWKGANR